MNNILALPERTSSHKSRMVFIGYKNLKPTGGKRKRKVKPFKMISNNATTTNNTLFTTVDNTITSFTSTNYTMPTEEMYRENDPSLCYCFNCKAFVKTKIEKIHVNTQDIFYTRSERNIYECPTCSQRVHEDDIYKLNTCYSVYRKHYLDGNMLKIKRMEYKFKLYNNHLFLDKIKHYNSLNLDTGYAYALPDMINGKLQKGGIRNVTYTAGSDRNYKCYSDKCVDTDTFYNEVYEIIRKYKMGKMNIFIPEYDYYNRYLNFATYTTAPNLDNVVLLNRFPTMPPHYAERNFNESSQNKEFVKLRRSIKHTTLDYAKDILAFYGLPASKNNKKKLSAHFNYPYVFSKLYKVIGNYDNVNKILSDENFKSYYDYDVYSMCEHLSILKELKGFNINSFCNRAKTAEKYIITDTLYLAVKVLQRKEDYKFNFKCSLKELHDTLSDDYNKLKHENVVIKYPESVMTLEGQYGELNFNLAKDTHELIDVGTAMHICVGGYGDRAVSKSLNIMIARNKDNDPVICIEMDKFYFNLNQTKLKHNHSIKEDTIEYSAIKEWAEKHNLKFDTWDVPNELKETHNVLEEVIKKEKQLNKIINGKSKKRKTRLNPDLNGLVLEAN